MAAPRLATLVLLWLTLLAAVAGSMILDPGSQPFSHKAFVALWNASNLVSTIGDFIALTHQQRAFLLVVGLTVLIVGGDAITTLTWRCCAGTLSFIAVCWSDVE